MTADLKEIVIKASQRPEVRNAVEALYARVGEEVDRRRPLCVLSGRCCRFEEYRHRLYVTTMELANFIHALESPRPAVTPWDGTGCPFQRLRFCSVHAIRPFGCRMFFCDATSTEWQNAAYEQFHAQLKTLHVSLDVPYYYLEWREALSRLGIAPKDSAGNEFSQAPDG